MGGLLNENFGQRVKVNEVTLRVNCDCFALKRVITSY